MNQFIISRCIFLRLLALVYLFAFAAFLWQCEGLVGVGGILPLEAYLEHLHGIYKTSAYFYYPSIFWFTATPFALKSVAIIGMLASIALFFSIWPRLASIICWFLTLSYCTAGQVFFNTQWDALLLEMGFLSIFLAPKGFFAAFFSRALQTPYLIYLFHFLLFRFIFFAGFSKIWTNSRDFWTFNSLAYHYEISALPTFFSWYLQQMPLDIQRFFALAFSSMELVLPCMIFMGRKMRHLAFLPLVFLQISLALLGNVSFLNLLPIILSLLLLDDACIQAYLPEALKSLSLKIPSSLNKSLYRFGNAFILLFVALIFLHESLRFVEFMDMPRIFQKTLSYSRSLRLMHSYGEKIPFSCLRYEIEIEGSLDGVHWEPYFFKYKAGHLSKPLRYAFYQPRLDLQMTHAALEKREENPWLFSLIRQLLLGKKDVLALLDKNPFSKSPPYHIRAWRYRYHYTNFKEKKQSNKMWWRDEKELFLSLSGI